ncbi:MAG: N-acetyltransferase [Defluviitaleaceae bacterium]|nr:N-acetyltransferase [Defluviitaleaceae bacterium]
MDDKFFVHESSYVDDNVVIGDGSKIWHFCHVQSGAVIGKNCILGQNVYVGSNVVIGDGCKIQNNVSIYSGVVLENYVFCGPSCVFTNDLTPRSRYPKGSENFIRTLVKQGATIGANATVICGNTVGGHSLIGAGGLVSRDVSDYALMLGVPARQVGWVCGCGEVLSEKFHCSACKRVYVLSETGILTMINDNGDDDGL